MSGGASRYALVQNLLAQGNNAQAKAAAQRLVQSSPRDAIACHLLAAACLALGEMPQALIMAQRACDIAPREPSLLIELGRLQSIDFKHDAAIRSYEKALSLISAEPNHPDAANVYNGLLTVLMESGRPSQALARAEAAIAQAPGNANLQSLRAAALLISGRPEEALAAMRHALTLAPGNIALLSGRALLSNYAAGVSPQDALGYHQAYEAALVAHYKDVEVARTPLRPRVVNGVARPLRIGIISPDLRTHPVATFIEPWLRHHDRAAVELFVYQTNRIADAVTKRLRPLAHTWRIMDTVDDAGLAQAVAADACDIAMDLSGHTHAHSLGAFVLHPAPVQVTYLGYPATTGLSAIDWRITDAVADPVGHTEAFHAERLLRLSPCFLCYTPPAETDAPAPRPPRDPAAPITFGSFNTIQKLSDATIDLWSRVLAAVPDARLLLKGGQGADAPAAAHLRDRFARRGVEPSRVEIVDRTPSAAAHLAMYNRVDIALDPTPYNGTTTTCEALWMGVPVITLAGDRHAARVGTSLLSCVGVDELVAADADMYVAHAAALARDAVRRLGYHACLRERLLRSPLCDARTFAQRLDSALLDAYDHAASNSPHRTQPHP